MKDMERRKFEDSFRDAFDQAEVTPSESVWTNVELDLEKASGGKMKRRILFYKLLAAASVLFAMCVAGVGYYVVSNPQNASGQIALNGAVNSDSGLSNASVPDDSKTFEKNKVEENNTSDNGSEVNADRQDRQDQSTTVAEINPNGVSTTESQQTQDSRNVDKSLAERNHLSKSGSVAEIADAKTATAASTSVSGSERKTNQNSVNVMADKKSRTDINEPPLEDADKVATENNKHVLADGNSAGVNGKTTNGQKTQREEKVLPGAEATAGKNAHAEQKTVAGTQSLDTKNGSKRNALDDHDSQLAEQTNAGNVASDNSSALDKRSDAYAKNTGNEKLKTAVITSKRDPALNGTMQSNDPTVAITHDRLPELVKLQKIKIEDPRSQSTADPFKLMMARLDDEARQMNMKDKKDKKAKGDERLWTSVGMAAGTFNTVNGRVSSPSASNSAFAANSIANQQAKATGTAYSVGLSMGTRISDRWVLQGGINYMNQSSDYTTSGVIGSNDNSTFSLATVKELNQPQSMANAKYVPSADYDVTNSLEFISVPVQAGYLVVNKKVGVQLNAGVSTDLFVQNTLATKGDVDESTQGSGSDSPYRTVNFSGLVGTEVSYRLGQHYRLALNPGLRYPLNSIYKSDMAIQAKPITFDVGLKFRYIFH